MHEYHGRHTYDELAAGWLVLFVRRRAEQGNRKKEMRTKEKKKEIYANRPEK